MKMIEMHIIQSFPVTCLNRDDLNSPKSATFGGVERARVSSQCWKRAIRMLAKEKEKGMFSGNRTRFIVGDIQKALQQTLDEKKAKKLAEVLADSLGKLDSPEKGNVKTLLYLSPMEIQNVAAKMLELDYSKLLEDILSDDKKKSEKAGKELSKLAEKAVKNLKDAVKDAADIALFGRMVADDHSLMVEGAANFSHAISTHKVSNEIDFFSAVDDLKPADSEGAGHIGTLEFNSACYYRYIGINLDLLRDKDHLAHFSKDELRNVLDAFIRACLEANPTARKNSQFGYTRPDYVLGLCRTGQPLSLANAFEKPVKSGSEGYVEKSVQALREHYSKMGNIWGIRTDVEIEIPTVGINEFVNGLLGGIGNE